MSKTASSKTQARLRKETAERDARMAKQKADRLEAEAAAKVKTDELEQHAKRVAALYKSMREFEAHAEEKAGFELQKAAEKRAALEQALVEARELCKAAGKDFKTFQEKYAPEYKRTRLYQVLAIADGRTTVEEVREGARERKRRQRAGESVRDKLTDKAVEGEAKPEPADKPEPLKPDQVKTLKALRKRAENLGDYGYWVGRRDNGEFYLRSKDNNDDISCDGLDGVAHQLDLIENAQPAPVTGSVERPIEEVKEASAALAGETPEPIDDNDIGIDLETRKAANGRVAQITDSLPIDEARKAYIKDCMARATEAAEAASAALAGEPLPPAEPPVEPITTMIKWLMEMPDAERVHVLCKVIRASMRSKPLGEQCSWAEAINYAAWRPSARRRGSRASMMRSVTWL